MDYNHIVSRDAPTERTVLVSRKSTCDRQDSLSPAIEERRALRKLDFRILPLTALLYLSAYLTRGNLGNARLQGLQSELLDGSDTKFSVVLSAFFVTYIIFSIPGTLLAKAVSPSKVIAAGAIIWATATIMMAGCNSYASLVLCRLMIGVGESLFGQSVALYYSVWYKKEEISTRLALFIGAGVSAGGFGGLLAYAVQSLGPNRWRTLYVIEGIPSLAIAFAVLFWLPSRPDQSKLLSFSERTVVLQRLKEDGVYEVGSEGIDWSGVRRALTDWKSYTTAILYSCMNLTLGSITGFLPSIISSMGHAGPVAQLYTIPPYIFAFFVMTLVARASDCYHTRAGLVAGVFIVSSIGWTILLLVDHHDSFRYLATFLVVIGGYCAIPLIIGWVSNNTGSESQRATSLGLLNSIGQLLAIASAFIFPASDWKLGFGINLVANLLAVVIALGLRRYFEAENKRRDLTNEDPRGRHDLAPGFRYVY